MTQMLTNNLIIDQQSATSDDETIKGYIIQIILLTPKGL